ncbi:caspase family protein [Streptomyces sp. HPF1205]|uniref:caspase family protein n=1 Tax=Streptomyces sp. HPF1205 TaxID=2873262 RepID=UPI001CECB697|nr:caspase family protein [Streptomyces sp. HPF1205]
MTTEPRRWVVTAGTSRYDHNDPLVCVPEDLETVDAVFTGLGYESAGRALDRSADELRRELSQWAADREDEDGALVLYYSGHGDRGIDERHYLLCRDSDVRRLAGTAVATDDLVGIVTECGLRRLLLIIDTCYAGQGGVEALRASARALATRQADQHRLTAFAVIAAARPQELARDGSFAHALRAAVADPTIGGTHQAKLYLEQVVDRVNEILAEESPFQQAALGTLPSGEGFPFLPNPRYVPDAPGRGVMDLADQRAALSREGRRRREELLEHFGPRGRGLEGPAEHGSYFSGRTAALAALARWADGAPEAPGRAVVVTGSAGVGKSSLLGRLVLLADPGQRALLTDLTPATRPPEQRVHAAIHARHKLLGDVVAGVADAAGHPGAGPEGLLRELQGRTEPLVIVVDALDEAGTAGGDSEPQRIAETFLAPLAALPCVRLAVGTRPQVRAALGAGFTALDLDDARWSTPEDLAAYARRLLLAPDGPGSGGPYTPEQAEPVARAIARRAGRNYLMARLVARALARRAEPVDTRRPDWAGQLPAPAASAFRWALSDQLGADADRARALLLPLAFAEGVGLSSAALWPAIASRLAGSALTAGDVAWILDAAAAHIVEAVDAGQRSVYRLYHESFADELRAQVDAAQAQAAITRALLALVPEVPVASELYEPPQPPEFSEPHDEVPRTPGASGRPRRHWAAADVYIRQHLATHAAAAGLIDELVTDPGFLLSAEPAALQRAMTTVTTAAGAAACSAFRRCAAILAAEPDPGHRAAQLHLAAVQEDARELAGNIRDAFPGLPWQALWATTAPGTYRVVGSFDPPPHALAVLDVGGRRVIAAAQRPGGVRWIDYVTGEPLGALPPLPGDVVALSACGDAARPWLLVQYRRVAESVVQVWDLAAESALGPPVPIGERQEEVLRVGAAPWEDRCVAALPERTAVRLVDMATGAELAELAGGPRPRRNGSCRTALGVDGDRLIVAAAAGSRRFDTSTLRPRNADLVVWTVEPGRGRRPKAARDKGKAQGNEVLDLVVVRGQAQVATSSGYRRGRLRTSDRTVDRRRLREWHTYSTSAWLAFARQGAEGLRMRVEYERTSLELIAGQMTVSSTGVGSQAHAWALSEGGAADLAVVFADKGPALKVCEARVAADTDHPVFAGSQELGSVDCESGVRDGRSVLVALDRNWPRNLAVIEPRSGERFDRERPEGWHSPHLARSAPGAPVVLYQRDGEALVFHGNGPVAARLQGHSKVWDLVVAKLRGEPVLVGATDTGVGVWDVDGSLRHHWRVGFTRYAKAVEHDGLLLIVSSHSARLLRVLTYPEDRQEAGAGETVIDIGPDEVLGDVGVWQGRPCLVLTRSAPGTNLTEVTVRDFTGPEPGRGEWRRRIGHRVGEGQARMVTVGGREALAVATGDHRLVVLAHGSPDPVADIHVGADIERVAPIDDGLLGVATSAGVVVIQFAPRP